MFHLFTGIGIDISDHHIRFAKVDFLGNVKQKHEIILPDGLIQDDLVVDPEGVKRLLVENIEKEKFHCLPYRTTVLLPESRVFSSSFVLPDGINKEDIESECLNRAQKDIPIPLGATKAVISQGSKEENGVRTSVYATPKEVLDGLLTVFSEDLFKLVAIEANTKAILRLFAHFAPKEMKPKTNGELIVVVDIGHSWATVAIYTQAGSGLYSRTVSYPKIVAKKGKQGAGLSLSEDAVDIIIATINDSVLFFCHKGWSIEIVILAGVEAADHLLEVAIQKRKAPYKLLQIGSVLKNPNVKPQEMHVFGAAIGAAIRSVHTYKYSYQHNFIS